MFDFIKTLCEWRQEREECRRDEEFMSSAIQIEAGHLRTGDTVYICDKDNRIKHTFGNAYMHDMAGSHSGQPFRSEWRANTYAFYNHEGAKILGNIPLHALVSISPNRPS